MPNIPTNIVGKEQVNLIKSLYNFQSILIAANLLGQLLNLYQPYG